MSVAIPRWPVPYYRIFFLKYNKIGSNGVKPPLDTFNNKWCDFSGLKNQKNHENGSSATCFLYFYDILKHLNNIHTIFCTIFTQHFVQYLLNNCTIFAQ